MKYAAALLIALSIALAACGDDEGGAPASPTPTGEATASPTSATIASPTPALTATPFATSREVAGPMRLSKAEVASTTGSFLFDPNMGEFWSMRDKRGVWSPDGAQLLVTLCCVGNGGIEIIDLPAGPATRIVEGDIASAAWSPDGKQIAFSGHGSNGPSGMFLINVNGTGLKRISEAEGVWSVSWSPRGDKLALVGQNSRVLELHDTGTEGRTEIDGVVDFTWSPDGDSLAILTADAIDLYEIDSGERRTLVTNVPGGPVLWSPDGSRLVFPYGESIPYSYGAYVGDPEVGHYAPHVFSLAQSGAPQALPPGRFPHWSPDGSRIAYLGEGCVTGEWDIFAADTESLAARRLTNTPDSYKEGLAWSPDGSLMAFTTYDTLFLLDVESGTAQEMLTVPDGEGLHMHGPWSPDGRFISFSIGGGHGICD